MKPYHDWQDCTRLNMRLPPLHADQNTFALQYQPRQGGISYMPNTVGRFVRGIDLARQKLLTFTPDEPCAWRDMLAHQTQVLAKAIAGYNR